MKKQIVLISVVMAGMLSAPLAALAEPWFDKYDRNHDHHWDWKEYYAARRAWEREHHERRLSEEELRAEYARLDANHDRHLEAEEAKTWGRW